MCSRTTICTLYFSSNELPSPNVRKVIEELANMNENHTEVYLMQKNQRIVSSQDMHLLMELQKFEQMKADIKNRNIQMQPGFKDKVQNKKRLWCDSFTSCGV
jgi:uncharacterized protein YbcV (DUF1398 family)